MCCNFASLIDLTCLLIADTNVLRTELSSSLDITLNTGMYSFPCILYNVYHIKRCFKQLHNSMEPIFYTYFLYNELFLRQIQTKMKPSLQFLLPTPLYQTSSWTLQPLLHPFHGLQAKSASS